MRCVLFCAIVLLCVAPLSYAAAAPSPGTADYAYFDGDASHPERQSIVVIGMNFLKDAIKAENCQTRTRVNGTPGDWHPAVDISRATEDEYKFKPKDLSNSEGIVEVRVKGADNRYTDFVVAGAAENYWERVRTSGSPHDCLGKTVQVKWCKDPKAPHVGPKVCEETLHALECEQQRDTMVVGVHFAAGSVSSVAISFDYSQIDVHSTGAPSNSELRYALVENDSGCPAASKYKDGVTLSKSYAPGGQGCVPESLTRTPGKKDVAVYFMFKRNTWPATLNINNVHIETTAAK